MSLSALNDLRPGRVASELVNVARVAVGDGGQGYWLREPVTRRRNLGASSDRRGDAGSNPGVICTNSTAVVHFPNIDRRKIRREDIPTHCGRGHPLTPGNLRIDPAASSDGAACNAGATAPWHFVVDVVALRENLHDRTVRRAGADEQGRDYRVRPDLPGAGSYPGSVGRRIATLCNRLHHGEEGVSPTVTSVAHVAMGYRTNRSPPPRLILATAKPMPEASPLTMHVSPRVTSPRRSLPISLRNYDWDSRRRRRWPRASRPRCGGTSKTSLGGGSSAANTTGGLTLQYARAG